MTPGAYAARRLRCIECGAGPVADRGDHMLCQACAAAFPVVAGAPVFLRRDNPLFSARSAADVTTSGFNPGVRRIARLLPEIIRQDPSPQRLIEMGAVRLEGPLRLCFIVGGGEDPRVSAAVKAAFAEVLVSDVVLQPGTGLVCDGHDLPLLDDSADMVVVTGALEHVLDPARVVAEISRVLRPGGVVVASTPFMQQVHMGAHDFTRFTDLGHRWLFRCFEEIARGSSSGPGSALLWSIEYFFRSLCPSYRSALFASGLVRLTLFWIKYTDLLFRRRPGALDAACELYFIGANRKAPVLTEAQLIAEYHGIKRPRRAAP